MRRSGNAKRLALLNVLSVDSSLKIELYEGICGRFGRIGVDTRSISDQQGMWFNRATDDLVKLHGLWVLVSLETRAHELLRPIFVPSIGRCAKVRRQG